jgi:hypothetical protein
MQTLFHDSHQHIDRYSNPDLGLHGIFTGTEEGLDTQMLFDPFEEQLDLPSAFVQLCDGQGRQYEVVCKEYQPFVCFGVVELDSPDFVRVILSGIEACENAGLIAYQAACTIDLIGIQSPELCIALGPDDKESLREVDLIEPGVIEIATIHDVERTGFGKQVIEDVDVVNFTVSDEGKCRNASSQIEQGVEFDCSFRLAEMRPREQRQTQVDSGGIKRIDSLLQLKVEVVLGIETPCLGYQHLGEIGIDTPVPFFIGFGQGTSSDTPSNAYVVTSGRNCPQTGFDITQTFTIGQLGEGHAEVLVPTGESLGVLVPLVTLNTPAKVVYWQEIYELCKNSSSGIHRPPPTRCPGEYGRWGYDISNR